MSIFMLDAYTSNTLLLPITFKHLNDRRTGVTQSTSSSFYG